MDSRGVCQSVRAMDIDLFGTKVKLTGSPTGTILLTETEFSFFRFSRNVGNNDCPVVLKID